MNNFLKLFVPASAMFIVSSASAETLKPNLVETLKMEERGEYKEAAIQLSPCLSGTATLPPNELEECLYIGERVVSLFLTDFYKKAAEQDNKVQGNNINDEVSKFGIKLAKGFDGDYYNNDYFRALAKRFPKSKHAEEFEYVLIKADAPQIGVTPWEDMSARLKNYLNKYPHGPYAQAASFWLGCIYEGLWSLLRPDTKEPGYREYSGLSSGNPQNDEKRALRFRDLAIQYYQSGLASKAAKSLDVDEYAVSKAVESLEALRTKGDEVGVGCIISD